MKTLIALGGLLAGLALHPAHGIEALRLGAAERIVVDGTLDEAAWSRARVLDRFYGISPQDKVEAKVRIEARFAYDGLALYVAVRAHDPDVAQSFYVGASYFRTRIPDAGTRSSQAEIFAKGSWTFDVL